MGHLYINNSYSDEKISKMISCKSACKTIKNFISLAELNALRQAIDLVDYSEVGETSKYDGHDYNDSKVGAFIKSIFNSKLKKEIGNYRLDFFAWQEAIIPWKIHSDLRWYSDRIPYKVILVPLDVVSDQESWKDTYTFCFKQRNYLRNNPNTNEGKLGNNDQSEWIRSIDDPNVENCIEGFRISKNIHKKYLSHMPYEFLEGLEIDNIFKWVPGDAVIWDQSALHCADNFLKNNIKTKLSLLFMTSHYGTV